MTSQNLLRLMNRRKGFKSTSDLTSYKISTVDFIAPNRGAAFTGIGLGERERYLNTSLWRQKLILTLTKRVFGIKSEIPITLMAASSTDDLPAVKDHVGELLKAHFDRSHSRWVWIMYNVTFFFQGSSLATSNFDRSNAKALTSHFTLSRNPPKKTHTHTHSLSQIKPLGESPYIVCTTLVKLILGSVGKPKPSDRRALSPHQSSVLTSFITKHVLGERRREKWGGFWERDTTWGMLMGQDITMRNILTSRFAPRLLASLLNTF